MIRPGHICFNNSDNMVTVRIEWVGLGPKMLRSPTPSGLQPARGGYGTYFRWKAEFGSGTDDMGGYFRTNHSCRLAPVHQGMRIGVPVGGSYPRWLGTRIGWRSAWSGGQAPALHSPGSPPLWIPAFAGMTKGGPNWRVRQPWSAGTLKAAKHHFRTNHSSRLAPAHQGMNMAAHPRPSGFRPAPE